MAASYGLAFHDAEALFADQTASDFRDALARTCSAFIFKETAGGEELPDVLATKLGFQLVDDADGCPRTGRILVVRTPPSPYNAQ